MGWQAAILHSWENFPDTIRSDVDYVISGPSPKELLRFLSRFCNARGWRLVQIIEHEPKAFFCVCIQMGGDYRKLALDVTWTYRRLGYKLLPSEILLKDIFRPVGKSFHVASAEAEAAYVIAKAAAKGKSFGEIRERLGELFLKSPEKCAVVLKDTFSFEPTATNCLLEETEKWFSNAPSFRAIRKRRKLRTGELILYLRRILHPTGTWLILSGSKLDHNLIAYGLEPVIPLFRNQLVTASIPILQIPQIFEKIIRTTLVLEYVTSKEASLRFSLSNDIFIKCKSDVTNAVIQGLSRRIEARLGIKESS